MSTSTALSCLLAIALTLVSFENVTAETEPALEKGSLMTQWTENISADGVYPEYPRPQMVRQHWLNLNGLWEYAICPRDMAVPEAFDGTILVPYPVESVLSGVNKRVGRDNRLWYRRRFSVPETWNGHRIMINFGAVDWETTVWINGTEMGIHRGGYDPFSFDITEALNNGAEQEIVVAVWDPTDTGPQPRGKQVAKPHGIWYTPVTGIWQTVWLEPVSETSVAGLVMVPDVDAGELHLSVESRNIQPDDTVRAVAIDGDEVAATVHAPAGEPILFKLSDVKLWSPESPFLYGLEIAIERDGAVIDSVSSYFGMRKIGVDKDDRSVNRLFLNNKPLFQFGPLDQGWWPDGLYTAPTDEAMEYDVKITKELGFNMIRKHVKIEPARWYYHCDRVGMIVWQDMPNGDKGAGWNGPDIERTPESADQYYRELKAMIDAYRNHPSIVMWVAFNEGWGQFDTQRVTEWIKRYDPSRLVNEASGWSDRHGGDVRDIHMYPGPAMPPLEPDRAAVLGEFGGLGLPIEGHLWQEKRNWGYRTYTTPAELRHAYGKLIRVLRNLIGKGLAAAVYTQTTDVETEVNGLMTYDRDVVKMGRQWLAEVNSPVYLPPPVIEYIVPTSETEGQVWRFTTEKPKEGWQEPDFDDGAWEQAVGVFGTEGTPGAIVRTEWNTPEIWLRREFNLDDDPPENLFMEVLHDEDAEVYLNGLLASDMTEMKGYVAGYITVSIDPEARKSLKKGTNVMAVHCSQTEGGQSIDVGMVTVIEPAE